MREDILDYELEAVHGCSLVKWRLGENQNSKHISLFNAKGYSAGLR